MPVRFILAACFYGVRRNTYLFLSLKPTMGPCSGQLQKRRSHHTLRHASHRLLNRRRDGENVSRPIGPEELVVLVQYHACSGEVERNQREHDLPEAVYKLHEYTNPNISTVPFISSRVE